MVFFVKTTDMVAKGISQDDIPENWVGRWANRSFRMRTMTVSESSYSCHGRVMRNQENLYS